MKNIFKEGIKQPLVYGFVLLIVLVLSFPLMINGLMNTGLVKKKISSIIFQKTDTLIDSSTLSITVFPQPGLEIDNFNIQIDKSFQLNISHLQFNIDLKPLLHGRIQVDQISIDRPSIIPLNHKKKTSDEYIHSMSFADFEGLTQKVFSRLPGQQKSIKLVFNNILSPYFERMDGSLILSRKKQDIVLNYTIKNLILHLNDLKSFDIQKHLVTNKLQIKQLKSYIQFNDSGTIRGESDFENVRLYGTRNDILFDSNLIQSNFILSDHHQQISILPFDINTPKARIGIVLYNNLEKKESRIDFNGSNINVGQARQMALNLFKDNEIVSTLFDILYDGFVHEIHVSFSGDSLNTLFDENHLQLSGTVGNGQVKIPNTDLIVSKITADASVNKGVLDIQAKTGLVQGSNIKKGDFSIDLLNYNDYPFKGNFQLDIDLSKIPQTLISLLPDTQLAHELALIKQISGRADAFLGLVLKTGSNDLNVIVKTKDFSTTGQYARIPGDIQIDHINFAYDSDVVTLGNLTGMVQNCSLSKIDAMIDFNKDVYLNIKSGSGHIDLSHLTPWLLSFQKPQQLLFPLKKAEGKLNFSSMLLSGPVLKPELWTYQIMGNGQNISVSTQADQNQIERLHCQYQASDKHLKLNGINATLTNLPGFDLLLKKEIINTIKVPIKIKDANFDATLDQKILNGDLTFNSGTAVQLDLTGQSLNQLRFNRIRLKDKSTSNMIITSIYNQKETLFDFKGRFNTQTFDTIFTPNSYLIKKINTITRNQPIIIHSDERNDLNIYTKQIDLNPFLSFSDSLDFDRLYLPNQGINLRTDILGIKKMEFTNIKARISMNKNHSYIRLNQAYLCDLKAKGYFNFKDNMIFVDLPFESVASNNVQNIFTCLMKKEKFMDGQYSLKGNLLSSSMKKDFLDTIQGGLNFNADNGRIYKLTLLSRILSVLNVSNYFKGKIPNISQQGFAYRQIIVEADIKESKIVLQKAVIDGNDMTIIFKGWIDPINDQLDLTCLVAPFKTIDLIIKYIPIVNTMLNGRLISVPVKATGKLSDPVVTPLHPSAVGTGLIDMMGDILKTPIKLWDKISNE
ncbi:MAG: AsmA-like C-terminal domain-containing protein [Pseudomonadota bacterium]